MLRYLLVLVSFVCFCYTLQAQKCLDCHEKVNKEQIQPENIQFPNIQNYDGSFQFQLTKPVPIAVHKELLEYISQKRKKSEDCVLHLSENCDVLILSDEKISAPGFTPFKNAFIIK